MVVWGINGTTVTGGGSVGNPGPNWHALGAGDFNGDGRADIVWQNDNGEVVVWDLNGTSVIGGGTLGNPGPSWHAMGTGDYNHDGRSDILFQNSSGEVVVWEVSGNNVLASTSLGNPQFDAVRGILTRIGGPICCGGTAMARSSSGR